MKTVKIMSTTMIELIVVVSILFISIPVTSGIADGNPMGLGAGSGPSVVIVFPATGTTFNGKIQVDASVIPSTGSTITSVQMLVDGTLVGVPLFQPPFSFGLDSLSISAGTHSITVQAINSLMRTTVSAPIALILDPGAPLNPVVKINSPSPNAALSGIVLVAAICTTDSAAVPARTVANAAFFVDGAQVGVLRTSSPFSFVFDTATLINGIHIFSVRAIDSGGAQGTDSVAVTTTNAAMTVANPDVAIYSPTSGSVLSGKVLVTAAVAAAAGQTIAWVSLFVDGAQVGTATSTAPYTFSLDTTSLLNGQHTLMVKASDTGARQGSYSISVTTDNVVNPDNPAVSITSPSDGATVVGTISVAATVTPAAGQTIATVALVVDGNQLGSRSAAPFTFDLVTTSLSNAVHTIKVQATDGRGKQGSASISVTVANNVGPANPRVTITSPTSGTTVSGTFTVVGTAAAATGQTITTVTLSIDGTVVGSRTAAPWTFVLNTGALSNGAHTLLMKAIDGGGRQGTASISVTTYNAAKTIVNPTVAIASPGNGALVTGTISVTVVAMPGPGQTISSVTLSVDGVQVGTTGSAPYTFSLNTELLTDAAHTLTARATDGGGRQGLSTASVTVANTVLTSPTVVITSPSLGAVVSGTIMVLDTVNSSASIQNVRFVIDGTVMGTSITYPYSWGLDTSNLTDGDHLLLVEATDVNGHRGNSTVVFNVSNPAVPSPVVKIDSPIENVILMGTITVSASVTSNATLSYVELWVRGIQLNTSVTPPFTWVIDTQIYQHDSYDTNGAHAMDSFEIEVKAFDIHGGMGHQAVRVYANNPPPTVIVDCPAESPVYAGQVDVFCNTTSVGLSYEMIKVDGTLMANVSHNQTGPDYVVDSTKLTDGSHSLNITLVDIYGKRGYQEVVFHVDNAAASQVASLTEAGLLLYVLYGIAGIIAVLIVVMLVVWKKKSKKP